MAKRSIIFRGRRSYNQEWVEGSLAIDNRGDSHIIPFADLEECGHHLRDYTDKPMFFDQETIGQFTGLTDKNGVKIFEGDRVSNGKRIWIVSWHTQGGKWYLELEMISKNVEDLIMDILSNENLGNGYYSRKDLEVIGNIHDKTE